MRALYENFFHDVGIRCNCFCFHNPAYITWDKCAGLIAACFETKTTRILISAQSLSNRHYFQYYGLHLICIYTKNSFLFQEVVIWIWHQEMLAWPKDILNNYSCLVDTWPFWKAKVLNSVQMLLFPFVII